MRTPSVYYHPELNALIHIMKSGALIALCGLEAKNKKASEWLLAAMYKPTKYGFVFIGRL